MFDISSLIVSAQFWPSFNKESLQLPEEIENEFKKYTKAYEAYKGNRTLNWRTVTGRVNIEIEIGDRTMEMVVSPILAVIIYHFQTKSTCLQGSQVLQFYNRMVIFFFQMNGLSRILVPLRKFQRLHCGVV